MDTTSNLTLIQNLFKSFGAKDIPTFLSYFTPDAVWTEPGDSDIPYSGSYTGHAGIGELLTKISQLMQMKAFVPTSFFATGNQVAVYGNDSATVIATGKSYSSLWSYVFTIDENSKVTNLQVYMDTLAIAKAFTP